MPAFTSKLPILFALFICSIDVAAAHALNDKSCDTTPIHHDSTLHYPADTTPRCFETFLPESGILLIEAGTAPWTEARLRLEPSNACKSPKGPERFFEVIERVPAGMLIEIVRPGYFSFCASSQDPEEAPGDFVLRSGFAPSGVHKDGEDPEEEEPVPDPIVAFSPYMFALQQLCSRTLTDDHSELSRCATDLSLGAATDAVIHGGDEDVFVFVIEELATVRITSHGEADTFAGLHGPHSYRIAADDDGGSDRNFRIVRTLVPGRYHLRVAGRGGAVGPYRLTVEIVDR